MFPYVNVFIFLNRSNNISSFCSQMVKGCDEEINWTVVCSMWCLCFPEVYVPIAVPVISGCWLEIFYLLSFVFSSMQYIILENWSFLLSNVACCSLCWWKILCIKCKLWLFLDDNVLRKLHPVFCLIVVVVVSMQFTVYVLRKNKNSNKGILRQRNSKHIFAIGKGTREWRGIWLLLEWLSGW